MHLEHGAIHLYSVADLAELDGVRQEVEYDLLEAPLVAIYLLEYFFGFCFVPRLRRQIAITLSAEIIAGAAVVVLEEVREAEHDRRAR